MNAYFISTLTYVYTPKCYNSIKSKESIMQLCVALDLPTKEENLDLIHKIKEYPVWLKVGLRSYIRDGEEFLKDIKKIELY